METKTRPTVRSRRTAGTGALLWAATAGQLVFGFLTALLVVGLIPADGVDFNVLGSLVLCAVTGPATWVCWAYRRSHNDL